VRIALNLNYFLSQQENIFLTPSVALPLKDFLIREYSSVSNRGCNLFAAAFFTEMSQTKQKTDEF